MNDKLYYIILFKNNNIIYKQRKINKKEHFKKKKVKKIKFNKIKIIKKKKKYIINFVLPNFHFFYFFILF